MNILAIGDTHIPFEHRNYLDFCKQTYKKFNCKYVVHIGDLVDFHAISSRWDADPDGFSPYNELQESLRRLKKWYKAFPQAVVMVGNHDERLERAGIKYGLSREYFRPYKELFDFPKRWEYKFDHYQHNVRFFHGMGYGGKFAHANCAVEHGQSVVMGHLHSNAGVHWYASESNIVFGLATGCGIDRNSYAFKYGRDFRRKPILGCGIVTENGTNAQFIPMKM